MHGPINFKSPNNISKWQMGFNSAFKGFKIAGEGDDLPRPCNVWENKIKTNFKKQL
jgi:hypothetical protein